MDLRNPATGDVVATVPSSTDEQTDAAIEHLRQALAEEDALPARDRADVLFQIAQIQAVQERWRDVIATLETWLQVVRVMPVMRTSLRTASGVKNAKSVSAARLNPMSGRSRKFAATPPKAAARPSHAL